MPSRHRQFHRPSGQLILADMTLVQAVLAQGASKPHHSTAPGDKFRVRQGGAAALTAPTVADGGAAEFDVAISGSGPWDITITWLGAGLAALGKGLTTRTITVTSTGAANSPLSIPVRITVL